MIKFVSCIAYGHDYRLLLLATLVCLIGSIAAAQLYHNSRRASGLGRVGWLTLASLATGSMVWCTHFVAMMAYRAHVPVALDPILTLLSLLIAVTSSLPGLIFAATGRRSVAVLGGALVGAAIGAMHYTGMAAYQIEGIFEWNYNYVAASLALGCGFSALAFFILSGKALYPTRIAGGLVLALAVVSLHFTGMSALTIIPLHLHDGEGMSESLMTIMAICTASAGLLVIICAAVSAAINTHAQSEAYRRLHRMALHDSLTDLPNRHSFTKTLQAYLAIRKSQRSSLAIVMIDLSRFKAINDSHGHQAGDQVLRVLAARFGEQLQGSENVARLGGDEFAALKPYKNRAEVDEFLHRLKTAFQNPFCIGRAMVSCGGHFGVALAPSDGEDPDTLLANADLAMYRAKASRSTVPCFYESTMDQKVRERRDLATRLRVAIGTDQFELHYQVQASLETAKVVGYEALLRWTHPELGRIVPDVFIPLAEEIGEIVPLGNWVIKQACQAAAAWNEPHTVAVNLSPLQLSDITLFDCVQDALRETGLPPHRLELELTESAIISDRTQALETLQKLKSLGISIALDDFGIGYSSLDVLRAFSFDKIKLDRSFVAEIEKSEQAVAIFSSIVTLATRLRIPVLAEGIENLEQLKIVASYGCSSVQGYMLGRPSPQPVKSSSVSQMITAALHPEELVEHAPMHDESAKQPALQGLG